MSRRVIIDELEFEVPYGKLAAKTWHEETDECKRVLALHGWMDNSGSFDNMMPHLKHDDGLYIVALDLPGHGRSSQLPPGSSYSDLNIVMEIRRCVTELNWIQPVPKNQDTSGGPRNHMINSNSHNDMKDAISSDQTSHKKFTIIGHSLGAGVGLYYASLFPNDVEEIILLDFMKSRTTTPEALLSMTADTIDQFISTVPSQSPFSSPTMYKSTRNSKDTNKTADKGQVVVSQEAAIIATVEAHKQLGVLTREDATCLLKRSTIAVSTPPNSVIYSRDLRLQSMLNMREHWDVNKIMFAKVKCHTISLLAKQGLYAEDELFRDKMDQMEEFLKSRAKSYYVQWLTGDHYVHMNKPQFTANVINQFLKAPLEYRVTE